MPQRYAHIPKQPVSASGLTSLGLRGVLFGLVWNLTWQPRVYNVRKNMWQGMCQRVREEMNLEECTLTYAIPFGSLMFLNMT